MIILLIAILFHPLFGNADVSTLATPTSTEIALNEFNPKNPKDVIEKEFEKALVSLGHPIIDVSLLDDAPQAALLLNSMSAIASSTTDASLENNRTIGAIHLLKTPRSFRASMYQVGRAISEAFQIAHQSMLAMHINLDDVPEIMTSMITAYTKPNDKGSKFLMDLQMKNFVDIVKMCTEESTKAVQAFNTTVKLIDEFTQATTATAGDNEAHVEAMNKVLTELDEQKKNLKEELERIDKQIEEQRLAVEKAERDHESAVEAITHRGFLDKLIDIFGGGKEEENAIKATASMYLTQQERLDTKQKEHFVNRQQIGVIASQISNSNVTLLNFKDVVHHLSRGVKLLGEIQTHWIKLKQFFESIHKLVIGPITRNLLSFESIAHEKSLNESEILRNGLIMTGVKSASICISVARAANIYNDVSQRFVMPLVDGSVSKLALSKEEAKVQLSQLKEKMDQVTKDSGNFIKMKLHEAERIARDQIAKCRDEFKEAFASH